MDVKGLSINRFRSLVDVVLGLGYKEKITTTLGSANQIGRRLCLALDRL